LKIIYAFWKKGEEGAGWRDEISAASDSKHTFIPFNQEKYLDLRQYWDSVKLDQLYQERNPSLMRMYTDFEKVLAEHGAQALVVCDAPPFHPDYLRKLSRLYKVLHSKDDPESTYQRNIPYLHAYQHVFYVTPAYTPDMDMVEKMQYCGMVNADFVPMCAMNFDFEPDRNEEDLIHQDRDIDILYVGAFHWRKIPLLVQVKKVFGRRFQWYGYLRFKHNAYLNLKYRLGCWVRPVNFAERRSLHQRAKIGINVHNGYAVPNVGNQRLYYLGANGVMQLSDGMNHLNQIFQVGKEIIGYESADDLIAKIHYYLEHEDERIEVARQGYRRVMRDYRFGHIMRDSAALIEKGMARLGWQPLPDDKIST
jgi:glycosyltransferase involved in cell wall biosynthesis